ncbi:MAG: ATP-binding protein [bacterium]
MFFWSLQILVEPAMYTLALYLAYLFINERDMQFYQKLIIAVLFSPFIILLSSKLTLSGVSLSDCTAMEGPVSLYYTYIYEIISVVFILEIFTRAFKKPKDALRKKEIQYFCIGIIVFLLAFSWGNLIGSFTDNWALAQAGLIGMPIFVGFLGYLVVNFKTFNIKILATEALIFGAGFMVLSLIFIRRIENVRIVAFITLLFIGLLGRLLLKSVNNEVVQKKEFQDLTKDMYKKNIDLVHLNKEVKRLNGELEGANEKLKSLDKLKTEFLSLASHQLRSPLTAIKGYTSMILEGDFGEINPKAKEAIDRVYQSSQNLVIVVEDLLNTSKIESGGMKYVMAPFSLAEVATSIAKDLSIIAEKRGLKLTYDTDPDVKCMVEGDTDKIRQVVLNLVDNSIKYTKTGGIEVTVRRKGDKVRFAVKDTGMGMTPEIKATLFQKFARGEGQKMNTSGSGLGLYLAKEIVEAHKGRVGVDSDGPGKGSTFYAEFDALKA